KRKALFWPALFCPFVFAKCERERECIQRRARASSHLAWLLEGDIKCARQLKCRFKALTEQMNCHVVRFPPQDFVYFTTLEDCFPFWAH
ncbi:hypothetical protein M5D96_000068, partial [Drosophila gunungcola]